MDRPTWDDFKDNVDEYNSTSVRFMLANSGETTEDELELDILELRYDETTDTVLVRLT